MSDDKPAGPEEPEEGKQKLPPRAADWHSGLKREDPDAYRATAPDTVSDFLASSRGPDSPDWDPIEGDNRPPRAERVRPASFDEPPHVVPVEPEKPEFYRRRTRISDLFIALLLGLIAFGAVVFTYTGFGHSWDEALYLKPAERAAAWMVGVFNSGDDSMLQRDAVDRHWGRYLDGYDPLHPEVAPIPKLLIGAGLTYLQPLVHDPMVAMRLPNAILFGLTISLLFLIGAREYGRIGGFAAALFYLLMPRVFGHAHIAASETPLAFFTVLTVWCFLIGNRYWPMALFTGIAFGLAVDTKISALMLPVPLMLWGQIYKRREYASNVFAMAFFAPVIILALWPWLWYDGLKRFFAYLLFYLEHQATAVFYMNRLWGYTHGPVAPYYYPPHIAALSLPLWILFFLALGLLRALFSSVRRPVTILFLLMAAAWIGISMLPTSPKYDGERLFFPAFAFLALLAAGGFSMLFAGVHGWRRRRDEAGAHRETGYIAAIALFLCIVYGAIDIFLTHPNELNYYNWIVGRAKGAQARGFETAYWGEAVNEEVTSYLNGILKPGDKVKTLALNELAFENLRQWGKLPAKVDFSPDYPPYDYVIMQVRQGFMGPVERQLYRSRKPLRKFEAHGVPKILVFAGQDVNDVFPQPQPPPGFQPGSVFDQRTTETEKLTVARDGETTAPAIDPIGATPEETLGIDAETTATVPGATQSTGSQVLDLTTGTAEARSDISTGPAVAETLPDDVATTQTTFQPPATSDRETSAPGIYEGDLPSTAPLENEEDL